MKSKRKKLVIDWSFGIILCISFLAQHVITNAPEPLIRNESVISEMPLSALNMEWEQNLHNTGADEYRDVILDAFGNIYVTGTWYNNSNGSKDILIRKYDSGQNLLWSRTWGGTSEEQGWAIDIDPSNNLYITGSTESYGNGSSDVAILKYDLNGNRLWNQTWGYSSAELGHDILVNDTDSILVAGYTEYLDGYGDVLLLKLDSLGNKQKIIINGTSDVDCAYGIAKDEENNIYLTGYTGFGSSSHDLLVMKFNHTLGFNKSYTWGGLTDNDIGHSIVNCSDGLIIAGETASYEADGVDIGIWRLDFNLGLQWNDTFGTGAVDGGKDIKQTSKGTYYIVGQMDGDGAIVKVNATGSFKDYKLFGGTGADCAYGIAIDDSDYLHVCGKVVNVDEDAYLGRFSPFPDEFSLSSPNAGAPDTDGTFTLSWTESTDANNYTLYSSNTYFTNPNGKEILLDQTPSKSHGLTSLAEGRYYYLVEATNDYGNTTSNCYSVQVQYPPGAVKVSLNNTYQKHGIILLNWSSSIRADNYSVYYSTNTFSDITAATLIAKNLTTRTYQVSGLTDGQYFFRIVSVNEAGQAVSNEVNVTIARMPIAFTLSTNIQGIDVDGNFSLTWTRSVYSTSYDIYQFNSTITIINDSVELIYSYLITVDKESYTFNVKNARNGTSYYCIQAINAQGSCLSNCVKVIVSLPKEYLNDNSDWLFWLIFSLFFTSSLLFPLLAVLDLLYYRKAWLPRKAAKILKVPSATITIDALGMGLLIVSLVIPNWISYVFAVILIPLSIILELIYAYKREKGLTEIELERALKKQAEEKISRTQIIKKLKYLKSKKMRR